MTFAFRARCAAPSILLACCAALLLTPLQPAARNADPVVAAASDLQFALEEVAAAFHAETGLRVRLAFGSSGNFARQIRQGAPFQLYLSADEEFVFGLSRDGFTRDDGALYAIGRLAIIVPHGSPLRADGELEDLAAALAAGRIRRFAIANPEHAPYGMRAEEALRHRGLWSSLQKHLIFGENVSQAAQFATSGDAQGGIIAWSLAKAPNVAARGQYALIPADLHAPLRQRMVLLANAGQTAETFYDYLQQSTARGTLRRHGFLLPDEHE